VADGKVRTRDREPLQSAASIQQAWPHVLAEQSRCTNTRTLAVRPACVVRKKNETVPIVSLFQPPLFPSCQISITPRAVSTPASITPRPGRRPMLLLLLLCGLPPPATIILSQHHQRRVPGQGSGCCCTCWRNDAPCLDGRPVEAAGLIQRVLWLSITAIVCHARRWRRHGRPPKRARPTGGQGCFRHRLARGQRL
jgi:hypothetical protein